MGAMHIVGCIHHPCWPRMVAWGPHSTKSSAGLQTGSDRQMKARAWNIIYGSKIQGLG